MLTFSFMDVCFSENASHSSPWGEFFRFFFDQHYFNEIAPFLAFLTSFQVIPFTHTSPHEFRWSVTVTCEFIAMTLFVCCCFFSLSCGRLIGQKKNQNKKGLKVLISQWINFQLIDAQKEKESINLHKKKFTTSNQALR